MPHSDFPTLSSLVERLSTGQNREVDPVSSSYLADTEREKTNQLVNEIAIGTIKHEQLTENNLRVEKNTGKKVGHGYEPTSDQLAELKERGANLLNKQHQLAELSNKITALDSNTDIQAKKKAEEQYAQNKRELDRQLAQLHKEEEKAQPFHDTQPQIVTNTLDFVTDTVIGAYQQTGQDFSSHREELRRLAQDEVTRIKRANLRELQQEEANRINRELDLLDTKAKSAERDLNDLQKDYNALIKQYESTLANLEPRVRQLQTGLQTYKKKSEGRFSKYLFRASGYFFNYTAKATLDSAELKKLRDQTFLAANNDSVAFQEKVIKIYYKHAQRTPLEETSLQYNLSQMIREDTSSPLFPLTRQRQAIDKAKDILEKFETFYHLATSETVIKKIKPKIEMLFEI